jgi:hypothetical protein
MLHKISNDNGVRLVNVTTSKNLTVKSTMFPYCNIHKYTWISLEAKTHSQIGHILIEKRKHSNVLDVRSFTATDCGVDNYLVVAKIRKRTAMNKQGLHKFSMERFNLKKLIEASYKMGNGGQGSHMGTAARA